MAEIPVGVNTIFIDVGKGPEPFTVISDYAGSILSTVIPDLQAVKSLELLPPDPDGSGDTAEQGVASEINVQLLPQNVPPATEPVNEPTSEPPITEEEKSCIRIQTRRLKCPECPKYTAENEEKILRHVRKVHRGENPFACLMCDYSTYNKTLFEEHVHIHQGIKPYKCSHCDHSSASKKNLKKHELIHRPDNPLRCTVCPFIANNSKTLKKHKRDNHNHKSDHNNKEAGEPTKQFECQEHSFTTTNKKKWNTHNWYHHKLFVCKSKKCKFTTTQEKKYNEHVKNCMPVEEKNAEKFQCKICDWSSKQDAKILLHLIHHPNQQVDESVVDISILRKHGIMP